MERTVKIVLTLLIMASLVLALSPGATYADDFRNGGTNKTMTAPEEIYMVIEAKDVTQAAATFNVTSHAVKTVDGRAKEMNFTKPLTGQYFFGNDTAIITTADRTWDNRTRVNKSLDNRTRQRAGPNKTGNWTGDHGKRAGMGYYNNTTIRVAGASAVVATKNLTGFSYDNGTLQYQFTDMIVYLPNGTSTAYKLGTPVTVTMKNDVTTVRGNPEMRGVMQGFMMSGERFPANAGPVRLTDIDKIL